MAKNLHPKNPRNRRNRNVLTNRLIASIVGAIIGLLISSLFAVVIVIVVFVALQSEPGPTSQLLNTAMTLVGSALGAVLGFFFGRRESQ